jgi:tRNA-specific adenosine deaminase 2
MNSSVSHEELMHVALQQAEAALAASEVPVGCAFVDIDGKILTSGHNKTNVYWNGTQHAEIVAINDFIYNQKRNPSLLIGSILYVTCEPCIMCAAAIGKVGVSKVVFGCHNERFGGNGSILSIHNDLPHKYEVEAGFLKEQCIEVFQRFYESENRRAPENKRRKKNQIN